jgi:hypothetical protein
MPILRVRDCGPRFEGQRDLGIHPRHYLGAATNREVARWIRKVVLQVHDHEGHILAVA